MQQHRILGAFLFKKYGIDSSFFNETYTPSQIYVRSADFNRTITSATSNMVGMYYNRNGDIPGLDYPAENGWPNGYVPIPIHMIQQSVDHVSFHFCVMTKLANPILSKRKMCRD
ncbi:unnamed protein product [Toxocara canis]|uniref:COesterase domain-containing protein n=1 Tax=Toxocara canis TaxID=6265 RepID=A0A183VDC1_TOXCA|nr:unnamed protein product [Toxocara canis]